jgi:hypothetical protein
MALMALSIVGTSMVDSNPWRPAQPTQQEIAAAQAALEGMRADLKTIHDETTGVDGLPVATDIRLQPQRSPTNDIERIRVVQQGLLNDMADLQKDYMAALEEAGLSRLLDAQRVLDDTAFTESYLILRKLRATVQTYRKQAVALISGGADRFAAQKFDYISQSNLRENYAKGVATTLPTLEETWALEMSIIDHFGRLIHHLQETRVNWNVENGQFAFSRTADLNMYNEIMAEVQKDSQRQADLRSASINNAMTKMDDLKSSLSN